MVLWPWSWFKLRWNRTLSLMNVHCLVLITFSYHTFMSLSSVFLLAGVFQAACPSVTHFTCFDSLVLTSVCPPSVNYLLLCNKHRFLPLPAGGVPYFNISHLLSFPSTVLQHPKWSIISDIGNKCVNTHFEVLHFHCVHCGQKHFLTIWYWNADFKRLCSAIHTSGEREIIAVCANLVFGAFHTSRGRPHFPH